jgi:hypothetical protein
MSVPSAFTTGLAQRHANGRVWLEIAGLPYAYGNFEATSSWFASRSATQQFEGVKSLLGLDGAKFTPPQLAAQRVDHVEGRVDLGQLVVRLNDTDGSLLTLWPTRRTDGRLSLATSIDYADEASVVLTQMVAGIQSDAAAATEAGGWGSSGVLYFPRETIGFTARSGATFTISNSTRGKYRSERSPHRGFDTTRPGGEKLPGEIVTQYPRSLQGRRCWLYFGLDADDATDGVLLFAGVIRGAGWENGAHELVLDCDDWQGALKRPLFADVFGGDPVKVAGDATLYLVGLGGTTDPSASLVGGLEGIRDVADDTIFRVVADDKIVTLERDSTVYGSLGPGGGVRVVSWLPNNPPTVGEVAITGPAVLVAGESQTDPRFLGTGFCGYDGENEPFEHPLQILLAILTSTGYLAEANGAYDVLPREWGLGIPQDEIDVAGIERIIRATPQYKVCIPVVEPVTDAREFIVRELLKPFGFYLRPVLGSTVGIGWLHEPTPADLAAATTLSSGDLAVDDRGQFVKFSGPAIDPNGIIGQFVVSTSPRIIDGKIELAQAGAIVWPVEVDVVDDYLAARAVEIEAAGIHDPSGGFPALMARDEHFPALAASYASRFGLPPVVLSVACTLDKITLNVGDLVLLDFDNVPSIYAASRGLSGVYGEVTQKAVDLARGIVDLEITQSSLGTVPTRAFAPCCIVTAWDSGTKTLTVTQNEFTEAGVADDTDAFADGYGVRLYRADMATRYPTSGAIPTIASRTATTVVLDSVPTGYTFAAGDVLTLADYTEQPATAAGATAKARFAFLADSADGYLGTADAANEWDA